MTNRIEISTVSSRGLNIPAYCIPRDGEHPADAMIRAIRRANPGAARRVVRAAGEAADGGYYDQHHTLLTAGGNVIGSYVLRCRRGAQ